MQPLHFPHTALWPFLISLAACSGGDNDSEQMTSVAMTGVTTQPNDTGGDEDDCEPGTAGCPCSQGGMCFGELVCASQLCVDFGGSDGADEGDTEKPDPTDDPTNPSDPTTDPSDPTDDPTSNDTGGGPPGSCEGSCGSAEPVPHLDGNCFCGPACTAAGECCPDYQDVCGGGGVECFGGFDCEDDEICTSDLECGAPWGRTYSVCVNNWADYSPTCWDFDDCYADVYFNVYYGGNLVFTSTTHDESVMTSWAECATVEINSDIDNGTESNEVLSVVFYDEDGAGADDLVNIACHADGDACTFIPLFYLHDGYVTYTHDASYLFDVELIFSPLE